MAAAGVKSAGLTVLKHQAYRRMRWRNGRGSTLEIARDPPAAETFAWRLSLAEIERDGGFSAYPGYRRALVLVAGSRLRLRFRRHGRAFLDTARPGTRFEGEWRTSCAIPQGPCTDLSLIVRKGAPSPPRCAVRAPAVLRLVSTRRLVLHKELWTAVFVLGGSVGVGDSIGARRRTVRERDTVLLSPGDARTLTLHNIGPSPARLVILRWRPGRDCPDG